MSLASSHRELSADTGSSKGDLYSPGQDARKPHCFIIDSGEPLNLEVTLSSGQTFRWKKENSGWWLGFIKGNRVLLRQIINTNNSLQIECKVSPSVDGSNLIEDYFNLSLNYQDIYSTFNSDPILNSAVAKYEGLRLLSQDPWEILISFILSSASNIPRIKGNIERLCEKFGEKRFDVFGVYHTFPLPDILAAAKINDFKKLGFGYRASYVWETSLKIAENPDFLSNIGNLPYISAKQELCRLSGVGEKVADCVLLFAYARYESFPVDTWIQKIVEKYYFNGKSIPVKKLAEFGRENFGIYAGIAQQYLFEYARGLNSE